MGDDIDRDVVEYLKRKYGLSGLEDVQRLVHNNYAKGALVCRGEFPEHDNDCWFFAGYEAEIKAEIEALG